MCFRVSCLFCACMVVSCLLHHVRCVEHHHVGGDGSDEDAYYVKQLFAKYGHDDKLSFHDFEHLLSSLSLKFLIVSNSSSISDSNHISQPLSLKTNPGLDITPSHVNKTEEVDVHHSKCLKNSTMVLHLNHSTSLNVEQFIEICPAMVYQLDRQNCHHHHLHSDFPASSPTVTALVWLYAMLSILVISLCGLLSVAIIPLLQRFFYQPFLQLLIGLAIGSLAGDALLHLLPHALTAGSHGHSVSDHHIEDAHVWQGLSALAGAFVFFIIEKALNIVHSLHHHHHSPPHKSLSNTSLPKLVTTPAAPDQSKAVGEKLSHHKHGSYGYSMDPSALESLQSLNHEGEFKEGCECNSPIDQDCHRETVVYREAAHSYVVTVTDHHHSHHSHGSSSSVAWVVIMGDALHNFCDGIAIGAAYAGDVAGGLSTSIAVFCHELPHEMGDFAILLKTGMSPKQALLYNGLSSLVCFVGVIVGLLLGKLSTSVSWIYSSAAGMFLYIAFVDMVPQLNSGPSGTNHYLLFQIIGIFIGITIMLIIALYEHELGQIIS